MEYRVERIGGGCCRIWMHGQGGPAIYWGTAHEEEQVRQDTNVRASELVWHNGGHFTDVDQRIAQVFIWLIRARGKR
ncbi:MAG: hypothetical protein IKJ11_05835 [Clostridia bacterium]|nr:hypothetical protein [Clostridia bacterium]